MPESQPEKLLGEPQTPRVVQSPSGQPYELGFGSGWFHFHAADSQSSPRTGWKMHVSAKTPEALEALAHLGQKYNIDQFKFIGPENFANLLNEKYSQSGKTAVFYHTENGADGKPIDWHSFAQDAEAVVNKHGRPGPAVQRDRKLAGSEAVYYRNDLGVDKPYAPRVGLTELGKANGIGESQLYNLRGLPDPFAAININDPSPMFLTQDKQADMGKLKGIVDAVNKKRSNAPQVTPDRQSNFEFGVMHAMLEGKNAYDVLGVKPTASSAELGDAFRLRAKEATQQVNAGEITMEEWQSKMADNKIAYALLDDPGHRVRYNNSLKPGPAREKVGYFDEKGDYKIGYAEDVPGADSLKTAPAQEPAAAAATSYVTGEGKKQITYANNNSKGAVPVEVDLAKLIPDIKGQLPARPTFMQGLRSFMDPELGEFISKENGRFENIGKAIKGGTLDMPDISTPKNGSGVSIINGKHRLATLAEQGHKTAFVTVPEDSADAFRQKYGATPRENSPSVPMEPSTRLTGANTGAQAAGVVMGAMGFKDAYNRSDHVGEAIAGSNVAVSGTGMAISTVKLAEKAAPGLMTSLGENAPRLAKGLEALKGAEGGLNKANYLITIADGVYQVSQEDTAAHKTERAAAVTVNAGASIGAGTLLAGEATGVLATSGTVATGATVAAVAAPIVIGVLVAKGTETAIQTHRTYEDLDKTFTQDLNGHTNLMGGGITRVLSGRFGDQNNAERGKQIQEEFKNLGVGVNADGKVTPKTLVAAMASPGGDKVEAALRKHLVEERDAQDKLINDNQTSWYNGRVISWTTMFGGGDEQADKRQKQEGAVVDKRMFDSSLAELDDVSGKAGAIRQETEKKDAVANALAGQAPFHPEIKHAPENTHGRAGFSRPPVSPGQSNSR